MNAIRYPPTLTRMSQICPSNSGSLPARASAWLHPLNVRSARFRRRSSLLTPLSLSLEEEDGLSEEDRLAEDDAFCESDSAAPSFFVADKFVEDAAGTCVEEAVPA